MKPHISYLICGTGRTGSTFLCESLKDTGVAGRPDEYFNQWSQPSWPERLGAVSEEAYLAAALREGTSPNGVFGAKIFWEHLRGSLLPTLQHTCGQANLPPGDLLAGRFPGLHYIFIRREDHIRQAISWLRGNQSRVWVEAADAPEMSADLVRFDAAVLDRVTEDIDAREKDWHGFFNAIGVAPLQVVYEEFAANPEFTVRRVLDYIGVEAPKDYTFVPRLRKQSDDISEEWVHLYESLRSGANIVYSDAHVDPGAITETSIAPRPTPRRRSLARIFGFRKGG